VSNDYRVIRTWGVSTNFVTLSLYKYDDSKFLQTGTALILYFLNRFKFVFRTNQSVSGLSHASQRISCYAHLRAVLWIRIRIRICKGPCHLSRSRSRSVPRCLGSGSVSYSNGTTKLTGRENLKKNTFCVGPVGPTDKENK
jgi:hypothetical protein